MHSPALTPLQTVHPMNGNLEEGKTMSRTSCLDTKRYNDARLELSAEMGRGQLNASNRIGDAFAMLASANSGGGANMNGAGTVTTGA